MAVHERTPPLLPYLLSNSRPDIFQTYLALTVSGLLALACLATMPFATTRLEGTEGLLPAYAAAVLLVEVITAALLLAVYSVQRSSAVLVLAAAYLVSGLLAIPWALTFPGVFDAFGLSAGMQSAASIAAFRRLAFGSLVLVYAILRNRGEPAGYTDGSSRLPIIATVSAAIMACCALLFLVISSPGSLPGFMSGTREVSSLWAYVPATALALYAAALVTLLRARRTVLDLWLLVVLATLVIEVVLLSYVSAGARLSLGWWAGRIFGLLSASLVLMVLLSQTATLHGRLADAVSRERRTRESRLIMMEALSASIAHEINQPLSSMVTNANAAARWLQKPQPDVQEAIDAIRDIVGDGHRAGGIIEGIRLIFQKSSRSRDELDLILVASQAVDRWRPEANRAGVALSFEDFEGPAIVSGNGSQLQQAVSNLVANALDAANEPLRRERTVRVRCRRDRSAIVVCVEDNGDGVAPELRERIFDAFFTTKAEGMGMGLMFCRSVIEGHGGRLWFDDTPQGAAFCFSLPLVEPGQGRTRITDA